MKHKKLFILTKIICCIVSVIGSNLLCSGAIRSVNPSNVRGIVLKSVQMIFDGDFTRESISKFNDEGKEVVIEDSVLITKFFNLLNDCSSIFVGGGNVMSDVGTILFSDGEPFETNRRNMEPYVYGLIYFNDGRPIKPFWINFGHIEIDDEVLKLTDEMNIFLGQGIDNHSVDNDHIIETIRNWNRINPNSSNICGIEVYSLTDDNNPLTTRHSFIKALRNGLVHKYQIVDPAEIKQVNERLAKMIVSKTLDYSVLIPRKIGRVGNDGRMIWEEDSSQVTGFLKIIRDNESIPELIWITPTKIERDHYQLTNPGLIKDPLKYIFHKISVAH